MMLALTVYPEWTCMIDLRRADSGGYHADAKRTELRTWLPPESIKGHWFAIHAGKNLGGGEGKKNHARGIANIANVARGAGFYVSGEADNAGWWFRVRHADGLDVRYSSATQEPPFITSAIIGIAKIVNVFDVNEESDIPGVHGWKQPNVYGWRFEYRRLNEPVPCSGSQGLWMLPKAIEERCKQVGTMAP